MQRKLIPALVASIFTMGASATALAHVAAEYNPANDTDVFISGATAPELALLEYMADEFCTPGTLDIYIATNQFVYYCTPNASLGLGSTRVALRKSSVGGSGNGTGPACARATTIPFINFSALGSATFPTATVTGSTRTAFSVPASFTTTGASVQVDAGVSDLEPSLFPDLTGVASCFTPPAGTTIVSNPLFAIIFGVPVTTTLRNELQAAQGLTVGSETAENMPSLTMQQLRSIYFGTITNTSSLGLPTANPLRVVRRVGTSGTQRSFAAFFGGQRCIPGVRPFVGSDAAPAGNDGLCSNTNAPVVFAGSGSQNVVNCMNRLNANSNAAARYAVGVLSTEFVPNTSTGTDGSGFRFIKISGAVPNLLHTLESRHEFYYEATCQYRSDARAEAIPVLQKICGGTNGSPAAGIGGVNVIKKLLVEQTFGPAGVMGLYAPPGSVPPTTLPMTTASVRDFPVQSSIRAVGGGPNSCQPPLLQVPTSNDNPDPSFVF